MRGAITNYCNKKKSVLFSLGSAGRLGLSPWRVMEGGKKEWREEEQGKRDERRETKGAGGGHRF